jgi:cation diffusion facilitator CzcD-associated flavoprotein CzcO
MSAPEVALVGGGLAALSSYAALRQAGVATSSIAVFGVDPDPAAVFRVRAAAIRQTHMRSESDGHVLPRSFPGLAAREAARTFSAEPLVRSVLDRYRPSVDTFLAHVSRVRRASGWDESFRRGHVQRVQAVDGGFVVDGVGPFRHVLLAPGHPGLSMPPELESDPRAVHAYEPHEYARRVAVVGAGMAAATEWLNALRAGSVVLSVRRRDPLRRPLNLPRPLFSKRGLASFQRAGRDERVALLRDLSAPSYPPGRVWDEPLALANGRFSVAREIDALDVEQVVCATGFRHGFRADPLLARLAEDHALDVADDWIVLGPDATVPALTDSRHTLALAGVPAQWAFPAADTLAGMRYVAHRFAHRCRTR